jgi:hypothetical protein
LISRVFIVAGFVLAGSLSAQAQQSPQAAKPAETGYIDTGFALLNSASAHLGTFIADQTQNTRLSVYGCLNGASGPICSSGDKADHIFLRQPSGAANGVGAVGLGGDLQVWQPYMMARATDAAWTMHNLSGVREPASGGAGFKTQWMLSYDFTHAFSAGVGGSYSLATPEMVDARYGALAAPRADQRSFGAFFQLQYRFGQDQASKAK